MAFLQKLFRRSSSETSTSDTSNASASSPPTSASPPPYMQPQPLAPNLQTAPPHGHAAVQAGQNLGMAGGALIGMEPGGVGMGMGAVDGMVLGNIVGQRIQQHQKHQFWRSQAQAYNAGLPAQGVGDANADVPVEGRQREGREGREEKRRKRWAGRAGRAERRAERRGE